MNPYLFKILRLRKVLLKRDIYFWRQLRIKRQSIGSKHASWVIDPTSITKDSVVYSFGVGTNITFDLGVIQQFQATVYAFDPTPTSITWLEQQKIPENFIFHPYGIAEANGKIEMFLPEPGNYTSASIVNNMLQTTKKVEVDVFDLTTIMNKLGHNQIDLLKMDIEGAEYGVINHIVSNNIKINQILIEFHHRFPVIGIEKTKWAVKALNKAGYKIFDVSPSGEEFSFIRI